MSKPPCGTVNWNQIRHPLVTGWYTEKYALRLTCTCTHPLTMSILQCQLSLACYSDYEWIAFIHKCVKMWQSVAKWHTSQSPMPCKRLKSKAFTDPWAGVWYRLSRIRSHGRYLKAFDIALLLLLIWVDAQELRVISFFVGAAIHSLHHRSAMRCERQFSTSAF